MSEMVDSAHPAAYAGVAPEATPVETPIFTRRMLLTAAVVAGMAAVAVESEYTDAFISRTFCGPNTEHLPAGPPPELAGTDIDRTNEHYQPDFSQVIRNGVDAYKAGGGTPFYKRPDFYITEWDALTTAWKAQTQKPTGNNPYDVKHPYERLMNFSLINVTKPGSLSKVDPGSSTRPIVEQRLQALGAAAGKPADPKNPLGPTVGDVTILNAYRQTYHRTIAALDERRGDG